VYEAGVATPAGEAEPIAFIAELSGDRIAIEPVAEGIAVDSMGAADVSAVLALGELVHALTRRLAASWNVRFASRHREPVKDEGRLRAIYAARGRSSSPALESGP
jgi:hypothetical protein